MPNTTIERGSGIIIPLNVEAYSPTTKDWSVLDAASVAITVIDGNGVLTSYSLTTGVIRVSLGYYYLPLTCTVSGDWRATWSTTVPKGVLSVEWQVINSMTLM